MQDRNEDKNEDENEGKEDAKKHILIEVAHELLRHGVDIKTICQCTGLTKKELKEAASKK